MVDDLRVVSNLFNQYLAAIGTESAASIPHVDVPEQRSTCDSVLSLEPTTPDKIKSIVNNQKGTSAGQNGIPAKIIKAVDFNIGTPPSHRVNLSFRLFLQALQEAVVTPIHEGKSSNDPAKNL